MARFEGSIQDAYFETGKLKILVRDAVPEVYLDGVLVEDGYSISMRLTPSGVEFSYVFEEDDGKLR